MILTGEEGKTEEKTCPSAALSLASHTAWSVPELRSPQHWRPKWLLTTQQATKLSSLTFRNVYERAFVAKDDRKSHRNNTLPHAASVLSARPTTSWATGSGSSDVSACTTQSGCNANYCLKSQRGVFWKTTIINTFTDWTYTQAHTHTHTQRFVIGRSVCAAFCFHMLSFV